MHDQADHLRTLVRDAVAQDAALAPGAPVVVISAARSGAGATMLVLELARHLALLGKRTALVDANLAHPHLVEALKLKPRGTIADVCSGARSIAESLVAAPHGTRVLAGAPADFAPPLGAAASERFAGELRRLARSVDLILLDAGPGMNPWVDRLWRLAAHVLLATDPEPATLLDAYAMVKQSQFHRLDHRLRLVVNRWDDRTELAELDGRFAETCRRFLCIEPRAAHAVPRQTSATARDDAFTRAVRLLAADLACDATPILRPAVAPLDRPAPAPTFDPRRRAGRYALS